MYKIDTSTTYKKKPHTEKPPVNEYFVLGVFFTWRQQDKDNVRDFSTDQVYINKLGDNCTTFIIQ